MVPASIGSNARSAASESVQLRITVSPCRSTLVTPGSAASTSGATPGIVALIRLKLVVALISVAGPSATTRPLAIKMIRSA